MSGRSGIAMPTHCPQCNTATDPKDFHLKLVPVTEGSPFVKGFDWTYECLGCGEEKPTEEWVEMHKAKHPSN